MSNANMLQNKFLNRLFRRIDGVVWDLTTGKLGLQTAQGIHTLEVTQGPSVATNLTDISGAPVLEDAQPEYNISVNPFENFGVTLPAFAIQKPLDQVQNGDIVVGDRAILGWVVGKTRAALKLMDLNGFSKTVTPPKTAILGNDGILVVQNLGGLLGGNGLGNVQSSLLPLLALGGDLDFENILPLLLFQNGATGAVAPAANGAAPAPAAGMNPMMLMMLANGGFGGKGKSNGESGISSDKLMMMMAMGGLGGGAAGGGVDPMMLMMLGGGNLFGDKSGAPELQELHPQTHVGTTSTRTTVELAPPLQPLTRRR